jgi:hypothetical protein
MTKALVKLEHGPLDGGVAHVDLVDVAIDGELVPAPPAVIGCREPGHDEGCSDAVVHVYRFDVEQLVIDEDGTEHYVYRHDPSGAPA